MTPAKKKTETGTNLPEGQVPTEVKPIKSVSRKAASKPKEVVSVLAKTASKSDAPKAAVESVQPATMVQSTTWESHQPVAKKTPRFSSAGDRGAFFLGAGMLLMGIILLLGRLLRIPFGDYIWPFIFMVPGLLVFWGALSSESSSAEGLAILGGILTSLGALFFFQSVTGLWASWAYAWALIAPTSIGVSQMVYGMRKERVSIVQSGRRLVNLGLIMLAVGFVFFELIIGISGFGLGRFGLPVFPIMLIFIGVVILVRSLSRKR